MNTILLKGKEQRLILEKDLIKRIEHLPFKPVFCDVLVGGNKASAQYVRMKESYAKSLGIETVPCVLEETATTEQVIEKIKEISNIKNMSGLIVQLPLPQHIDKEKVLNTVRADIDVDCLSKEQEELFYGNKGKIIFPTVRAILHLLLPNIEKNSGVLVVGNGPLVGKPLSYLLENMGYQVTSISRKNEFDLIPELKKHRYIVSGVGVSGLIKGDMLLEDSVVIDAGTSESNGSVVGDVDFETLTNKPKMLAPVPGGVGPLTVYFLMDNVVSVAERSLSN